MKSIRNTRSIAAIFVAFAVLPVAAGCSDAEPENQAAPDSSVSIPTPSEILTADSTTTTMVAQLMAFESPGAAAKAVSAAWEAGDLQAAQLAGLAPPAELEKLFGAPPVIALKDRGCDDGIDGAANCFIANGDGGVNISLRAGERGWEIEFLDAY